MTTTDTNREAPLHPELEDASQQPALPPPARDDSPGPGEADADADGIAAGDAASARPELAHDTPLWATFRDIAGLSEPGGDAGAGEDGFVAVDLRRVVVLGPSSLSMAEDLRLHDTSQGTLLAVARGVADDVARTAPAAPGLEELARCAATALPWLVPHGDKDSDGGGAPQDGPTVAGLRTALVQCRDRMRAASVAPGRSHATVEAMMTVAYVVWPIMYVAHTGGGDCFHYRGQTLTRITPDDAADGQSATSAGGDSGDSSGDSDSGGGDGVTIRRVELARGDCVVLCTSGLTRHVTEAELAQQIDRGATCADTCDALVTLADERGRQDGASIIVGWL